jgi:acyl-CoA synthetase (AMP-forming)/AMP-acid ligase II
MPPPFVLVTAGHLARRTAGRELLHLAVDDWAARTPERPAIINATRGTRLSWRELAAASRALAGHLATMGLGKGDYFATSLPFLTEHIILAYACFRLGVIHVPLDMRLGASEVLESLAKVKARAYAFPGRTPLTDFRELAVAVSLHCPTVEEFFQFSPPEECRDFANCATRLLNAPDLPMPAVELSPHDGAQVIFTSGSTGSPKPALLSHGSIIAQNVCLGTAFEFGPAQRVLLNLPPSHVGGQAEILMTGLYHGGTTVLLESFDAALSLDAIEGYRVTLLGQIPAMFQLEWRLAGYAGRDLSSLRAAVYGGQAVPRLFLQQMLAMAPRIGTGLGLTESSGFCTYTALTGQVDELAGTLGWAMPVYPYTIRAAMRADGLAGEELGAGQLGHVCFRGPQNFLGYVNHAAATAEVLSRDGWLYTGDLGRATGRGLELSGRAKFVVKTAGYQVFPGDVEAHFATLPPVAQCGVVGQPHAHWGEALVAFVERRAGAELTPADLRRHARGLAGYMRPRHYVVLDAGAMPLNRAAKVDLLRLRDMAAAEIAALSQRGRWDGGADEAV